MTTDLATMTIETPDGYRYDLSLSKNEETTQINGEEWEDLLEQFGVTYYDRIVVNMDGDGDIFLASIFDQFNKEKKCIDGSGNLSHVY